MKVGSPNVRSRGFALLLLTQFGIYGYLILARRLPRGHDTLSVFLLQYLFMAGPVTGSAGSLWVPFLSHGVTSTWFANVQAGLLQNTILLVGGLPEGTPMLPVFYAGLFVEDLVLLIGVWRLSGRLYRSPSAQFLVSAAAVGSSMWVSNIFWAHRLVYQVPLALALLLDFVETGSRFRLLLAASLGALLLLGTAPYIPVLTTLSIFLFVGLYLWVHRKRLSAKRPLWRPRRADVFWIAGILFVTGVVLTAVVADLDSIRQYHRGRNPDGSVSLDSFLTYSGSLNPLKYLDFLFGLNASMDFSIYIGVGPLILAGVAVARRPRKDVLVVVLTLLVLVLFSMGYLSAVGMIGYLLLPPLHYFRYVGLAAGLVKIFLLLLSGFGVDVLVRDARRAAPGIGRIGIPLAAGGLLAAQWILLWARSSRGGGGALDALCWELRDNLAPRDLSARPEFLPGILGLLLGAGALLARRRRSAGAFALAVPVLLVLHGADLFRWRLQILRDGTRPLSDGQAAVLRLRPLKFIDRRTVVGAEEPILGPDGTFPIDGFRYDYSDALMRRDASWSPGYVTQWSPYLDFLLRVHAGRPLGPDPDPPPSFVGPGPLARTQPDSFARVIGESGSKLQVFSAGHRAGSDAEIAALMSRPDYEGNTLLLSPSPGRPDSGPTLNPALAAQNERLEAAWRILEFSADRLRLEVDLPPDRMEAWLDYCDAWHPAWTATVDGLGQPVERANLAYKAVRLHAGRNTVEFRFRAPLRSASYLLLGIECLLWILLLGAWSLRFLGIPLLPGPLDLGAEGGDSCYTGKP